MSEQSFDLALLEKTVVAANVTTRAELPPGIFATPPAQDVPEAAQAQPAPDMAPPTAQGEVAPTAPVLAPELISETVFRQQWELLHDMAGGLVQSRTGAPCPLGEQSRSEGGQIAANAAYELISSNPALARMILSTESTFLGQLAAIGMHGFACVQAVKASAIEGAANRDRAPLDDRGEGVAHAA